MVDFQSRDTSRSVDEEETTATDATDAEESAPPGSESSTDDPETDSSTDEEAVQITGEQPVSVAILVAHDGAQPAADAVADGLAADHDVLGRDERTGDHDAIQTAVNTFLDQDAVDAVVTVGGVGVGATEVTVEAVEPLLDATLPGFGELFRRRHEAEVGTGAIRTRTCAGIADGTPVVCLPGDADAATVATEQLLVSELDWLATAADGE
jgi:molybdenum cofactor biosynthesis protein B